MEFEIEKFKIILDKVDATNLYNELYRTFEDLGVDMAKNRSTRQMPMLYKIYDQLYEMGML